MVAQSIFAPKVEIFDPFKQPFSDNGGGKTSVVSPRIIEYTKSKKSQVVAKCTPCQCCACR